MKMGRHRSEAGTSAALDTNRNAARMATMSTYTDLDSLEICVQRAIDTKTRTNNPSDLDEVTKLVEDALTKERASASVVEGRLETIKKMVRALRKAGRIGLGEEFGVDD
jgi:hypothetical protein